MNIIIGLVGIYLLFYAISIFVSRELLLMMGFSVIMGFILEYGGVELLFSIIAIPFILWFVTWVYLQQKQKNNLKKRKNNLERPLINEEYGRCKECMSPNISLIKKENKIIGYQYTRGKDKQAFYKMAFYCKCNDCSVEFTNFEREQTDK